MVTCCEEGTQLRSEYKNWSAEWVKAEADLHDGAGLLAERFQRLRHAKREYRNAHSAYCNHLILCEQCREANNGMRLRA